MEDPWIPGGHVAQARRGTPLLKPKVPPQLGARLAWCSHLQNEGFRSEALGLQTGQEREEKRKAVIRGS